MYRFSRSIYRELAPRVSDGVGPDGRSYRAHLLESCEGAMRRLAYDRRYFAKPTKSLFEDVRCYFPVSEQRHVLQVIHRYVTLAGEQLDRLPGSGLGLDGQPVSCQATTRKGKACQREPLPSRRFCPSHKHLEELDKLEQVPEESIAVAA
ncbi:MAG: hypothetical protein ACR2NA_02650 [Solirubrobacterales bacterium]